jgi:hypothetical protein
VLRADAARRTRQSSIVCRRTHDNRAIAILGGEHERAHPCGAGFEQDRIARSRAIERGLKVITGANGDGCAGHRRAPAYK